MTLKVCVQRRKLEKTHNDQQQQVKMYYYNLLFGLAKIEGGAHSNEAEVVVRDVVGMEVVMTSTCLEDLLWKRNLKSPLTKTMNA